MNYKSIKIAFFGTPEISAKVLSKLIVENFSICAVFSQPDKSSGRGLKNTDSPVKKLAIENSFNLFQPNSKEGVYSYVTKVMPDLMIVIGYGHILNKKSLGAAKYGAINIHGSLLPRYRGSSPIQTTLLNGDKKTGITFIKMNDSMDKGDIIYQKSITIAKDDTAATLSNRLAEIACQKIELVIKGFLDNTLSPKKQDDTKATYCGLILKNDGLINWHDPAIVIDRQIRAYNVWPNAFTFWQNKKISILESIVSKRKLRPGLICICGRKIFIGAGIDSLEIIKLQLEGKKIMTAFDFINGHNSIDGYIL